MKRTRLKRMGKDKARETAKYWPLRRKFIEENPFCQFPVTIEYPWDKSLTKTVSCTNHTNQIHHMKGQHWKIMNDTKWWLGLCSTHHTWIEDHKKRARTMGLILYK